MQEGAWTTTPGVWVGAIGTLALFSLIYRENRFYRLFEHLFIGLAAGFLISRTTWSENIKPLWWVPLTQGYWQWIFAAGLGAMFYTSFIKKHAWMSRIAIGVLIALYSGQIFQQTANEYLPKVTGTFKPLLPAQVEKSLKPGLTVTGTLLNNWLYVIIVLCVVTYFFFSFEHKTKAVKVTANTGRLMMMFAFGAIFGSTVMARMALLVDRVWFLMHNWLHVK
jgi:hypothetical protein